MGPKNRSGRYGEEKNLFSLSGHGTLAVQPIARCYTDWAIPTHILLFYSVVIMYVMWNSNTRLNNFIRICIKIKDLFDIRKTGYKFAFRNLMFPISFGQKKIISTFTPVLLLRFHEKYLPAHFDAEWALKLRIFWSLHRNPCSGVSAWARQLETTNAKIYMHLFTSGIKTNGNGVPTV
jgi:hypothetical protein